MPGARAGGSPPAGSPSADALFRSAFEHAPVGILFLSLNGRILQANAAAQTLLGYGPDELRRLALLDITHAHDTGAVLAETEALLLGRSDSYWFEARLTRRSGSVHPVRLSVWLARTPVGDPDFYVAELESLAWARGEVEVGPRAPDPLSSEDVQLGADADGMIVDWNESAERLFGWTKDEAVGRSVGILIPEDRQAERQHHLELLRRGERVDVETERLRRGGERVPVALTLLPVMRAGELVLCRAWYRDLRPRNQALEALRESRESHRLLFETMGQGVVYQAADGRVLDANPAAERILGVTVAQMQRRTPAGARLRATRPDGSELRTEDHPSMVALRTGRAVTDVVMGVHNPVEERERWILVDARPLFRPGEDRPYRVFTTFSDLTPVRELETALGSTQRRLSALLSQLPAAVWTTDRELTLTWSAGAAYATMGADPGGSAGMHVSAILPADADRAIDAHRRALLGDHAWYEVELNGRVFEAHVEPLRGPDGIEGVIGSALDVTPRVIAERELQATRDKIAAVVETTPLPIIGLDLESKVTLWNQAATTLFGWTAEEVLGQPYPLRAPAGEVSAEAIFRRLQQGEVSNAREIRRLTRDGRVVELSLWNGPLSDAAGKARGYVAVLADISDRKALEEQLRQVQKMEAVGRLAGGVAHDFNNVLTAIAGHVELILEAIQDSDPLREDLLEIRKGAERATSLTRQLLAFSRKQIMQPRVIDLGAIVEELQRMVDRLIGEDIDLEVSAQDGLWRVLADRGQIEQVLLNLCVNARDAMPQGGVVSIRVGNAVVAQRGATRGDMPPGEYVRLSVSDTGSGILREHLPHIFEPFFTTKEVGKGTGLGLSTVYGIVRQSAGYIFVESAAGDGTTFSIYLPRVVAAAETPQEQVAPAPAGGSETVLIVEDEPAVRALARRVLTRRGYRIFEAGEAGEALAVAERAGGAIDLLLTDVVLPQKSGRELADAMRARWPALRVLFMSGYSEDAISHHGVLDAGVQFIEKPFRNEQLAAKVREVLDTPAV